MTRAPFLSLVCFLVGGCAQLEDVPVDSCGNQVRESGEDCDTFAAFPDAACRPAGSEGECRYDCAEASCPSGWGCGGDGICREATGEFSPLSSLTSEPVLRLDVADFDGDRRIDPLIIGSTTGRILFLDELGRQTGSDALALEIALPAIGELTEDGHADFAIPYLDAGVGVFTGQTDRRQIARTYASVESTELVDAIVLSVHEPAAGPNEGDELLAALGSSVVRIENMDLVVPLPRDVSELASAPIAARFDPDSGCEQIVAAFTDDPVVHVLPLCTSDPPDWNWDVEDEVLRATLPAVALVDDTVFEGVIVGDLNQDEYPDLIIAGHAGLHGAFGVGDGTFHSDEENIPPADGDGLTTLLTDEETPLPLAVGDVTGDESADFVFSDGVELGDGVVVQGGVCEPELECDVATFDNPNLRPWIEARIADFDGNGIPDIAAVAANTSQIDIMVSPDVGLLNLSQVAVPGAVRAFEVGDYDGNLLPDVAFSFPGVRPDEDFIAILFARPLAPPKDLIVVGRVDPVVQLIATDREFEGDGLDDLLVVSAVPGAAEPTKSIASVLGSTDQRPRSPFKPDEFDVIYRTVIGDFTGDGHDDLAVLTHVEDEDMDLWLVPSRGEGELFIDEMVVSQVPLDLDWTAAIMLPTDIDGNGVEEIVVLAPAPVPQTGGTVLVIRSNGVAFEIDTRQATEEVFWAADAERDVIRKSFLEEERAEAEFFHESGPSRPSTAMAGDLDGDGNNDVVALAYADLAGDAKPGLLIFRGTAEGRLDVPGRIAVPAITWPDAPEGVDPQLIPLAFTLLAADSDVVPELAFIAAQGTFLVEPDLGSGGFAFLRHLPAVTLPVGQVALAAGDVTGDGVQDLLVASGELLELHAGVAKRP